MGGLEIKPMTEADLPFLNRVRNECKDMLHDNRTFDLADTYEWFQNLDEDHKYFTIWYDDERVGYFRCKYFIEMSQVLEPEIHETRILEIGADIAPEHRGKGLAFKAYRLFLRHLKDIDWVELEVLGTNVVAYNLYKKLGFKSQSVSDHPRDGRFIPSIKMANWINNLR